MTNTGSNWIRLIALFLCFLELLEAIRCEFGVLKPALLSLMTRFLAMGTFGAGVALSLLYLTGFRSG